MPIRAREVEMKLFTALSLVIACANVGAQGSSSPDPRPSALPKNLRMGVEKGRVWIDEPGDGLVWVRGDDYKASFSTVSATLIPFLGSSAPRNFPIVLSLREVLAGATRVPIEAGRGAAIASDTMIRIPHGAATEVYLLSPGHVEQQIVIERTAGPGDLVVRFGVESELEPSPNEEGGLDFTNGLGGMRCGRAEAVDAAGRRSRVGIEARGDGFEMVVPAAFVSDAAFPLTIDPLWSTFGVSTAPSGTQEFSPDVAYDAASDRFLVVFEQVYSATDHDIYARLCDGSGVVSGGDGWIDFTTAYWANPRVASNNLAQEFLVVAERGLPGARAIWGRTRLASLPITMGTQFPISGSEAGEKVHPDVGGDPSLSPPTYYCIVWQAGSAPNGKIYYNLAQGPASLASGTSLALDVSSANESNPSISKCDGNGSAGSQNWSVVWQRTYSATDEDIVGAMIHWSGVITVPPFYVDYSSALDTNPTASSPTDEMNGTRTWMAAYQRNTNGGNTPYDLVGQLMQGSTSITGPVNLSTLLGLPPANEVNPCLDTDGCRFALGFTFSLPGSADASAPEIATIHVVGGTTLAVTEGPVSMNAYNGPDDHLQVTSKHSGGGTGSTYMPVWDVASIFTADRAVEAAIYDGYSALGTNPGAYFHQVVPACGGLTLAVTGFPALGYSVSVNLYGTVGTPYLVVGTPVSPVALCSGCLLAVDLTTATILQTASASATVPCEGALVNTQIAVQGADVGAIGACPGSPAFSVSEAFVITFL